MPITRTPIVDDSGTGMDGTVLNNAWKTELYNQIDNMANTTPPVTIVSSSLTGTVNDWTISGRPAQSLVEWAGAADLIVTGIAGGAAGHVITFRNTGTSTIWFAQNHGGSASGNRFFNIAQSAATPIASLGSGTFIHDGSIWVLTAHEQGAWITPTFAAGNYASGAGMTWTVDAADVQLMRWKLTGKTMTVQIQLKQTSTGGTASTYLLIGSGNFGGFQISTNFTVGDTSMAWALDNLVRTAGFFEVAAGGTTIACFRFDTANWNAASVNNTYINGQCAFEVI
jgi:hypothetical protein